MIKEGILTNELLSANNLKIFELPKDQIISEGFSKNEIDLSKLVDEAKQGAYFKSKVEDKVFFESKLDKMLNSLKNVEGLDTNLRHMKGENVQSGRGRFMEIERAFKQHENGEKVISIGKVVEVPGFGGTDIDILVEKSPGQGKWIENKHVKEISCDDSFKNKIDKMAAAVNQDLEVNGLKIKEAVFVNSGSITEQAKSYAENKGVTILDNWKHSKPA